MSQTHSIVCHATKERVWIGQGSGGISCFYSGEPATMEALRWFLDKNRYQDLAMICDDLDWDCLDYARWTIGGPWQISLKGEVLGVYDTNTLPQAIKQALNDDEIIFFPCDVTYDEMPDSA